MRKKEIKKVRKSLSILESDWEILKEIAANEGYDNMSSYIGGILRMEIKDQRERETLERMREEKIQKVI